MKFFARTLAVFFLTLIFISGCGDEPSLTGSSLIPPEDKIDLLYWDTQDSSLAQQFSTYKPDSVDFGSASRVLLGKKDGFESSILLRYFIYLPESLYTPLELDSLNVLETWIEMTPVYRLGNSGAPFKFTVNKINTEWSPPNFDMDSLNALNIDPTDVASNISVSDTLIKFNLENRVVLDWMKAKFDGAAETNYGIYLKETPETDLIYGFRGLSTSETNLTNLFVVVEKPGEFVDTIQTVPELDVHVVDGTLPNPPADEEFLSSGILKRGKLWFDLSIFPKSTVINSAELILSVDTLNWIQGTEISDSIIVAAFVDTTNEDITSTGSAFITYDQTTGQFSGSITKMIQRWISGEENLGMRLRLPDELAAANRVNIYSNNSADIKLHPRLKIYYTK